MQEAGFDSCNIEPKVLGPFRRKEVWYKWNQKLITVRSSEFM